MTKNLLLAFCAALFLGVPAETLGALQVAPNDRSGEALYRAACANCHGVDGTGISNTRLRLEVPLPDFTDCSFASREPDSDWVAVAHDGGPVRGFSDAMPAFGAALTIDELQAVMDYVRTLCADDDWPAGELNFPRAIFTEKAYPEDEAVFTVDAAAEGSRSVGGEIVYEKRFGARNQLEVVVPFGYRERASGASWAGGVGDLALGVKRALFHDSGSGTIFSAAGEIILPTGDHEQGFGKGTAVFEPFISFGQALPSDGFLHLQAGAELPFDLDRAEREAFWRGGIGKTFESGRFGRAWSPMVEVLAGRELESGAQTSWDLVPQVHFTLNTRQHVMANIGVRVPVTDTDVRSTQILAFILWDWFDGGFFEGW